MTLANKITKSPRNSVKLSSVSSSTREGQFPVYLDNASMAEQSTKKARIEMLHSFMSNQRALKNLKIKSGNIPETNETSHEEMGD